MRAWNVGCSMNVQRMISLKQKMMFFSCLAAVLFVMLFSNSVLGSSPLWDIEFMGEIASYSSGSSIDVVLQITARDVFEGVTVSINLPYGWSVSSGPSEYKSDEVTERSAVGWTVYGGSKESLDEITATVTSTNPALSETVTLSQAGALPRVDSMNSAPSSTQPIEDDVVSEPAEKEELSSTQPVLDDVVMPAEENEPSNTQPVQDNAVVPAEKEEPLVQKPSFFNFTAIKESIRNFFSREKTCEQIITYAKNKATEECSEFPSSCDVPDGWKTVESCYVEPVDIAPDEGNTSSTVSRILRALYYILIVVVVAVLVLVALSAYRLYGQRRTESDGKRYSFE